MNFSLPSYRLELRVSLKERLVEELMQVKFVMVKIHTLARCGSWESGVLRCHHHSTSGGALRRSRSTGGPTRHSGMTS
ncbi:hypothetical protein TNCV_785031 [Trichonephila clavipes]|nr:hypothetical protein TNCV_785031 [Trichonephila clavipes]